LQHGYKIKIHSALQFNKHTGLMKDYVEFFLKMKFENNEHYSPEQCEKINKSHNDLGFTFEIKSENTRKNPGLKGKITEILEDAYRSAILKAAKDTGLTKKDFPAQCPYTFEQIMNDEFYPE
jgi:hypothetical protein